MPSVYVYVVDRDFGFAPNPFHGYCSLATCKPRIRRHAQVGDWIIGVGGSRLKATGRCVFALHVTEKLTFDEYWNDSRFQDKKPVRNGSRTMMIGDNIYHRDNEGVWTQLNSHHSNPDGTPNEHNLSADTSQDAVLTSTDFFYFGKAAPEIPALILEGLTYRNTRNYRKYSEADCETLLAWLASSFASARNLVQADPYDFSSSERRYLGSSNKIV